MTKLDAITLEFARQVIEEETGSPLEIQSSSSTDVARARAGEPVVSNDGAAKLIARDDKKNPLISAFEWTSEAAQRILRVPAGFMRNQTQERIEELARERAATAIDLALVEDGIEIGKRMMAEMIANYPVPGKSAGAATAAQDPASPSAAPAETPAGNGRGYLNEVSPLTARSESSERREA
jgi:hypothetical protein